MGELVLLRHGQASFGAEDYDRLSDLGRQQARAVAKTLADTGWHPDAVLTGTLARQRDTASEMGLGVVPETHPGLDEYDFSALLSARFPGGAPGEVRHDRKSHFRALRETVLAWQRDEIESPPESWAEFCARVEDARAAAANMGARVLAVTSGGVIGRITAAALGAPDAMMMTLNLQVRNTALTRFITTRTGFFLHEFNAAPHFATAPGARLQSYS